MSRKTIWLMVLLLGVLVATLLWWRMPPAVTVIKPARGEAVEAIYATGQVEPGVQLPIAPRSAGQVVAVLASEGAAVKRGQVLVRLQDDDLASGVAELAAKAALARQQYARSADLRRQGFVAQAELDRARSERDAAEAALARSKAQRGYLQLTAPADGDILKRDVEVGQFVSAGQPLLYLACCAPLRVAAEVDEEDIGRVSVGQPVLLQADAVPGVVFDGTVSEITPKGDPVTRSYRVRIALNAPDRLRVGMTVNANIVLARRAAALLVPRNALQDKQLWLVRDGRLLRQRVQTGAMAAERVEIRSGLQADDQIVISPAEGLVAGRQVKPVLQP